MHFQEKFECEGNVYFGLESSRNHLHHSVMCVTYKLNNICPSKDWPLRNSKTDMQLSLIFAVYLNMLLSITKIVYQPARKMWICGANQWTGFYMISASVMKGLNYMNECFLVWKPYFLTFCISKSRSCCFF